MSKPSVNRRAFIHQTGAGAAGMTALYAASPAILTARGANETIGMGHIGIGVRGGTLLTQVAGRQNGGGIEGVKVVAICDVYEGHRQKGIERSMNPGVKAYVDYKELLADPNVDAVVVAVPDHWHKQILIDAAKAGKDVYIEKGWTRSVAEAKEMRAAVKASDIVMQLGHQARAQPAGIQAKQLIDEGIIGPVTMVRIGRFENNPLGRNIWRWYGWYDYYEKPDFEETKRKVDWERWLGNAPKIPFNFEHFWHWRCYWPYGTGVAGDLLSHEIDFVNSVLRVGIPDTCMTIGQNILLKDGRDVPDTWSTLYTYEKKGCNVTFDCSMNSAFVQPPEFRGKEGMLRFDQIAQSVSDFTVTSDAKSSKYDPNKQIAKFEPDKMPDVPSHMQDYVNSIRSRKQPKCNVDEAFVEAGTICMAVQSLKEQRMVRWDAEKEEIV